MLVKIDQYRILLLRAAVLYERHKAGREDPFNVFSVLRSANDEVNLHSRFLHALLDHQKSHDAPRENLRSFLNSVYKNKDSVPRICPVNSKVEREKDNVDILIHDHRSKQSVVIENKIWAADQHKQLQKYAFEQKKRGYKPYLLYLTPHGRAASEHSAGDLCYKRISYKKHIRKWLISCQKRAYDEPALRESIVQYRRLIGKLTGTDLSETYMDELKKLCMDANNIGMVHELSKALVPAKISLLEKLWKEIECKLKAEIPELPEKEMQGNDFISPDISHDWMERFVLHRRKTRAHGLYYKINNRAYLGVEVGDESIYFGVKYWKEKGEHEFGKLKERLKGFETTSENDWWPWLCWEPTDRNPNLRNPSRQDLELLVSDEQRQQYVKNLVSRVRKLWEFMDEKGLITPVVR